jgi:hypothetical protein
MGNLTVITHKGSQITLSMIKWGALRKFRLAVLKRFGFMNRLQVAVFIPHYEIAIFEGEPSVVFSKKPFMIFYFPNHKIAQEKFNEIAALIQREGLHGKSITAFIRNGKPREQGFLLVEDLPLNSLFS